MSFIVLKDLWIPKVYQFNISVLVYYQIFRFEVPSYLDMKRILKKYTEIVYYITWKWSFSCAKMLECVGFKQISISIKVPISLCLFFQVAPLKKWIQITYRLFFCLKMLRLSLLCKDVWSLLRFLIHFQCVLLRNVIKENSFLVFLK